MSSLITNINLHISLLCFFQAHISSPVICTPQLPQGRGDLLQMHLTLPVNGPSYYERAHSSCITWMVNRVAMQDVMSLIRTGL